MIYDLVDALCNYIYNKDRRVGWMPTHEQRQEVISQLEEWKRNVNCNETDFL